ncbi:MAG: hypothetical protein IT385_28120 [Deltaproteobacteria bacterium]|nr:hypothetical protein [Deltaproteobacteria bacterium]
MRPPSPLRSTTLIALVLVACGSPKEPSTALGDAAPEAAEVQARRDGRIRVDDQWRAVAPMIIHEAKMDLAVSCRLFIEQLREAGQPIPPLCYGEARRAAGAVRVIRVEHQPGTSADAMRRLAGRAEGAHFVVDRSGSRFQLLDLAFGARRDGLVRDDEVRVLAMDGGAPRGAAEATAPLVAELVALYPGARVEALDVTPQAPPTPPSTPPGPQPSPGGNP